MSERLVISVDAMGGANAPLCVIEAIANISQKHKDVFFLIHGDATRLSFKISQSKIPSHSYQLIHCADVISDDEQPIKALKRGKESSMRKAIDAVKESRAQACISAGNTGALMVMAKLVLGSLPGIKRPAIISIFPNLKDGVVMMDLGANTECDENNFLQFAIMGHCFAKIVANKNNPKIGILNVGVEEHKGRPLEEKAHALLKNTNLNYTGFAEPYDITSGNVDVAVTDGFTGNLVLKTAEGTAKICREIIKQGFKSSFLAMIGGLLARASLKKSLSKLDPRAYNGAMFVGVNGIVVKSHGSSDAYAYEHALQVTISLAKQDINTQISTLLSQSNNILSEKTSIISLIKDKLGL